MNTKWANKKLLIFPSSAGFDVAVERLKERRTPKKVHTASGPCRERKLTLLILIYIIYFEEFIVNLIRFWALMPFLWPVKNVNIELFLVFSIFNLRSWLSELELFRRISTTDNALIM